MKKLTFILFLIILSFSAYAWIDCEPDPCPAGYTDRGIWCEYGHCYRNCTGLSCTGDWVEVSSEQISFTGDDDEDWVSSTAYTPTNENKCYKFEIDASEDSISMNWNENDGLDCDIHATAGFWQSGKVSNPWYENLTGYWGDVTDTYFDYFLSMERESCGGDSWDCPSYESNMEQDFSIYCAPSLGGCNEIGSYSGNCDVSCYNKGTYAYLHQGLYEDVDSSFENLVQGEYCSGSEIGYNNYYYPDFRVYTKNTVENLTNYPECYRTNEAPNATNIQITPENPTVGDDLTCEFDYYDIEGFEEKDSVLEWYKSGTSQNISSQILTKENLSVNDTWSCSIIVSDGLANATIKYSENVTINTTVKNLVLYANNISVWNYTGYFSGERYIEIEDQINEILDNCTYNEFGICTIKYKLVSEELGTVNVSELENYNRHRVPDITVISIESNFSNKTTKGYVITINNTGDYHLYNLSYSLDTGNDETIEGNISELRRNQETTIYREYTYDQIGYYDVNFSIYNDNTSHSLQEEFYVGDLMITEFEQISSNEAYSIVKIKIENTGIQNLNNIDWKFESGKEELSSIESFNLTEDNDALIFVKTKYNVPGELTLTATANNSDETFTKNLTIDVSSPLDIIDFEIKSSSGYTFTFGFMLNNSWDVGINNLDWNISLGDGDKFSSSQVNLSAGESLLYYLRHKYQNYGTYSINITVYNDNMSETKELTLTIEPPLNVSKLFINAHNEKNVFGISVKNLKDWMMDINNVIWRLDTGEGVITNEVNLSSDDEVLVFIAHNYSKSGTFTINASATNGSISHKIQYSNVVNPFDIIRFTTVYSNNKYRVFQAIVNNTWDMQLTDVNFTLNTGESNIIAENLIDYNNSEEVLYWVAYNYTNTGTYEAELNINKSNYGQTDDSYIYIE